MKDILIVLFVAFVQTAFAQHIVSPDTVCVGTTVPFHLQDGEGFTTYAWSFDGEDITALSSPAIPIPNTTTSGTMFSVVDQATMVFDTATQHYYAFVTSAGGYSYLYPSLQRLDFGTNPNSIPTAVNLGNPNNSFIVANYANLEAVEIVLDDMGIYHAFLTNRGIVHFVFGNGLDNPPTQTSRIFDNPSVLGMGMQMVVINDDGEWRIFVGQDYGISNILRFDIGTDLNNIPNVLTPAILPFTNANPSYFAILKENDTWYLFTTSIAFGASLFRYTLGPNLQNNNPANMNLGNTGPLLNKIRGLNFIKGCEDFYLLGIEQAGGVKKYDFDNDINNTPTTHNYGQLYGGPSFDGAVMMKPYWYDDTLWALTADYSATTTSTVYKRALMTLPSHANAIKYYASETEYTFNTPGVYDIVLYCDQADPRGPQTFCKQIVVVGSANIDLGSDTTVCVGDTLVLGDSNNSGNIIWSTGATTPTIEVFESGTYWLNITGNSCQTGTDTIHVTFQDLPNVFIDNEDTAICKGASIALIGSGTDEFHWSPDGMFENPNAPTVLVSPKRTTTYYLKGTNKEGCSNEDSVTITVRELPNVEITASSDGLSCDQSAIQLNATGANSYYWTPEAYCDDPTIPNPMVTPYQYISQFNVRGIDEFGCENTTSIEIKAFNQPVFYVPNAFSPNNDGLNDEFVPHVYCGDFELTEFSVYSRYGQLVYHATQINTGWDGTFENKKADAGVYFWVLKGKDQFGEKLTESGDVTLLR